MSELSDELRSAEQGIDLRQLFAAAKRAADRIEQLEQWKTEATQVIDEWEAVWEAAGRPGPLAHTKASCVQARIEQLEADLARTRRAWVAQEDPLCDDICLDVCQGPCQGLDPALTGPKAAAEIRHVLEEMKRLWRGAPMAKRLRKLADELDPPQEEAT